MKVIDLKTRFSSDKLRVWQAASVINSSCYQLARRFQESDMCALTSQLRRAYISASSNIAKGSGRNADKDFAKCIVTTNRVLSVQASRTPVACRKRPQALNSRPSTLD